MSKHLFGDEDIQITRANPYMKSGTPKGTTLEIHLTDYSFQKNRKENSRNLLSEFLNNKVIRVDMKEKDGGG
ncbi:hypothetical protein JD965_04935 [Bacillus siamensis]|uniref:hypothetical protein n=1 Tax=Bacillus siamensis TaxID=659243 RepID=UPI000647E9FA|nr:hypothetical protein [Bacillus siamensis]QQD82942.1 hypothetical protein JD965_04935 [Bacillus siamensis]